MTSSPQEFEFIPPPEAPTFRPTWEEFQDALGYINKIRPVAEQYGICKIIPPPDWQPPFAVDVDNFKFTPRIQRINELEAHTRIKLNFLDQIAKFWDLQGSSLKIPVLEKKALDLYSLHKKVQDAGGAEAVTRNRGWNRIAVNLGFQSSKNIGSQFKHLYDKILKPFEIFNKSKEIPSGRDETCTDDDPDYVAEPRDYKPHQIPSRMAGKIPENEKNGRRSRRYQNNSIVEDDDEEETCTPKSKELHSLEFKGPGPKNAEIDKEVKSKGRNRKIIYFDDPLAKYICLNCGRGDAEEHMLLCDGCDDSYHTFCLIPALNEIPKGDWRCPKCVAVEVSKPLEAFGFEQAQKEYTLQSFGEMADKFKQDYFNMPVHLVPLDMAEQEYWRIVSSIDEDVTVEYGADLHTMDHGSGFPTHKSNNLMPADKEYANDSWNLNNLPIQDSSVLAHIGGDISGMKVPWMYVGMCFSTFCWHNEDHWSYSINYLHWGEPKTWYGVPGGEAEKFEDCMKGAAQELFQTQPDLLHQLVTIMNPNILMKGGVPIVRSDQHAGEFMITFPRSYHAGFNQGYNFAEAVNFAPPDWLPIGRECISHYSKLKRYCVFSHDELVCKMASANPETLDLTVAAATYQDMLKMVDGEKKLRRALLHWGVTNAEREAFELLPDDERQCDYCKTTCFLSAVTCTCTPAKLVCLRHYSQLCECAAPTHVLRYRYTLDELPPMLQQLKERAESFDNWASKVKQALEACQPQSKLDLDDLKELVSTAEERRFPDSELLSALTAAVSEANKCAAVAAHLAAKKVRTRTRGCGDPKSRLTLEELQLFYEQINSLACIIKEEEGVKQLLQTVEEFQRDARNKLKETDEWMSNWKVERLEEDDDNNEEVEKMEEDGPQKKKEKKKKKKVVVMDEEEENKDVEMKDEKEVKTESQESNDTKMDVDTKVDVKKVKDDEEDEVIQSEELSKLLEQGISLDIDLPELPLLKQSLEMVTWLEEVQESLEDPSCVTLDIIKSLFNKSSALPPHRRVEDMRVELQQLLQDVTEWDARAAELLQTKQSTIEEAEELLLQAKKVPAHMPAVNSLRDALKKAKEWQVKATAVLSRNEGKSGSGAEDSDEGGSSGTKHSGEASSSGGPRAQLLEVVETMLHKARPIPLKLSFLETLESQVLAAHQWLEKTAKTFLKKNTHCSLIEVLVPRTDIGLTACSKRNKRVRREESILQQAALLLDITPDQAAKSSSMVQAYKDCEDRELKAIRAIRSHNLNKPRECDAADLSALASFCVCHKPYSPNMLQCTICCDSFHPTCVPTRGYQLHKVMSSDPSSPADSSSNASFSRFACPACYRSRRPRLETILALLVSLQKVKMRLCEAGALQCLTERAMAWQDKAQHLLQLPDLSAAMGVLTQAVNAVTEIRCSEDSSSTSSHLWAPPLGLSSPSSDMPGSSSDDYTRVSSLLTQMSGGADRPLVNVHADVRRHMKDLLLEGDLLEVTVEESHLLWRLLQVAEHPVSKLVEFIITLSEGGCPTKKTNNGALQSSSSAAGGAKKRRSSQMEGGSSSGASLASTNTTNSSSTNKVSSNTNQKAAGRTSLKSPIKRPKLMGSKTNPANNNFGGPKKILKKKSASNMQGSKSVGGDPSTPVLTKKREVGATTGSQGQPQQGVTKKRLPAGPITALPSQPKASPQHKLSPKAVGIKAAAPQSTGAVSAAIAKTVNITKGIKNRKQHKTNKDPKSTSSSSDDDEVCAAAVCKIPVGTAVDWVQCDACNEWFHYVCVGLKDLNKDEDYVCMRCTSNGKRSKGSKS